MTREEKIEQLDVYCTGRECEDCVLNRPGLCANAIRFAAMSDELLNNCWSAVMHLYDAPQPDNVNHPQHYELPGGLECFDVIVATQGVEAAKHFCLCNAMKYLFRSQRKNGTEDIEKARWYLNKYHDLGEG